MSETLSDVTSELPPDEKSEGSRNVARPPPSPLCRILPVFRILVDPARVNRLVCLSLFVLGTSIFVISSEVVYAVGLRSPPDRFRIRDNDATILVDFTTMDGLQLSAEARALFQEGISMVLSIWSTLQLAIENEWGGRNSREKAIKLASDIFIWFTQTKGELYIDDLENLLDEAMLSLNTEVADGSIEEVSYELMSMHEECLGGNYDTIQRLRASTSQARPVQHVKQIESDDEEDDDDDDEDDGDMMVDVPETKTNRIPTQVALNQPNPSNAAPAEDGWVVVSSKKNKGRRN